MKSIKTILPIAAFAGLALSANAAVTVITPTDYVATSEFGGSVSQSIDGSGLVGAGDILSQTHPLSSGGEFTLFGGGPTFAAASVTFELEEASTVDRVHLWLYHSTAWSQVTGFDLEFTTTGGTTTVPGIAFNNALDLNFVQTIEFAEQTGVTHIKLSNMVVNLDTGGDSHGGWNEIRFGGDQVPEPSTTALLGLGGLALVFRRRK